MSFIVTPPSGQDPFQNTATGHGSPRRFPWWIPMTVGVVLVVAGIGLVLWPFVAATWILVLLFGTALIANGLGLLVRSTDFTGGTVAGILLILTGVFAMVFSEFTVNALVTFVGVALLLIGVGWLALAAKLTQGARFSLLLPPVLVIAGGIVALVWPEFSIKIVAVVCGLFTIMFGAFVIWTANRLRDGVSVQQTIIVDP